MCLFILQPLRVICCRLLLCFCCPCHHQKPTCCPNYNSSMYHCCVCCETRTLCSKWKGGVAIWRLWLMLRTDTKWQGLLMAASSYWNTICSWRAVEGYAIYWKRTDWIFAPALFISSSQSDFGVSSQERGYEVTRSVELVSFASDWYEVQNSHVLTLKTPLDKSVLNLQHGSGLKFIWKENT